MRVGRALCTGQVVAELCVCHWGLANTEHVSPLCGAGVASPLASQQPCEIKDSLFYFIDNKTEAQRNEGTGLESHSQKMLEPGVEPRSSNSTAHILPALCPTLEVELGIKWGYGISGAPGPVGSGG